MYLKNQDIKPLIAEEDITCYKVMIRDNNGQLTSMVKFFPYELNKSYHSEIGLDSLTISSVVVKKDYVINTAEKGFHSFRDIKNAILDYIGCGINKVMVKCIIPKGSIYYKGYDTVTKNLATCSTMEEVEDCYACETYVSDSIIIKEIVDEADIPFPYKETDTVTVEINDRSGNKVLLDMEVIDLYENQGNIAICLSVNDAPHFFSMKIIVDVYGNPLRKNIAIAPKKQ